MEPLTYTRIPCFSNSPAFFDVSSAGMCTAQLSKSVAEGLMDSIQRYHSDNSTQRAWDSIQSFVSTSLHFNPDFTFQPQSLWVGRNSLS